MMDHDFTSKQREELGDLQPLYDRLNQHRIPEPDTTRLLNALKPILAENQESHTTHTSKISLRDWVRLAWSQTKILETPFWASSLLLTLIGLLWGISNGGNATALGMIVLSPFIAVLGVAYIFRPATHTLWSLEQLSRYTPAELLYVRVMVILSINTLIAALMLLTAWTQGSQLVLWHLLLLWFSPLIGLMGIALYCSIRWNTTIGVIIPLVLWVASILLGWRTSVITLQLEHPSSTVIMTYLQTSNGVLILALMSLFIGVLLFYAAQRELAR